MCGSLMAPSILSVMVRRSERSFEWTLATTMSSRSSISGDWSRVPSSRMSTSIPARRRKSPPSAVDVRNNVQLFPKAFGAQAVGDLEVGGVVRQGEVVPAQRPGGVSHQSDRGPAVGPVAVAVQVAAEGGAQFGAAGREGLLPALPQALKIVGHAAVDRLPDDLERSVPDPLHALQPAVACPRCDLLRVQGADNPGCLAERLDLEGGGELAFQPERNLIEGINGIHQSILHPLCARPILAPVSARAADFG